jgi:hypothetical protein
MFKLVNEEGLEVKVGDKVKCFRGEEYELKGFTPPKHSASTGRVYVKKPDNEYGRDFFPSVFNLSIKEIDNVN